jgi:hypothetical protein
MPPRRAREAGDALAGEAEITHSLPRRKSAWASSRRCSEIPEPGFMAERGYSSPSSKPSASAQSRNPLAEETC